MKILSLLLLLACCAACAGDTREFCLDGRFDLGARYQGTRPAAGEWYPISWCVVSDDDGRVLFRGAGRSNPDLEDSWTVAYLPPDRVRIVNRGAPPDIEFAGVPIASEASRVRRLDPLRLRDEHRATAAGIEGLAIDVDDQDRPVRVAARAELPLRGDVAVVWRWDWADPRRPVAELSVDGVAMLEATGRFEDLSRDESAALWQATPGAEPVQVPGDRWPARVDMQLINLTDDVYVVRGVRTGFQHLVIDTDEGLVVGDAPAGWVELHHLPPTDLVPGLGVSGLSQRLLDFLRQELPGRPIRAVALTHFHDDHAGGARAFAAAGATIVATAASAEFLENALNRPSMPRDELAALGEPAAVTPLDESLTLGSEPRRARIVSIGANPHSYAMLGLWALDRGYFFVSDIHVPRTDADAPRSARAGTECWFADWAAGHLPGDVRVVNSHSDTITPVSRLARYLDSEPCRSAAGTADASTRGD